METTPTAPNHDKSLFWKAGMVIASYYVAVIMTGLILGAIWFAIFIKSGQSLSGIQNINRGASSYLYTLVILVMGLLGIRYGVRHVARKSLLTKRDISKIIVWFFVVDLLLLIFSLARGTAITYYPFVSLVINCLAIYMFSKSLTTDKNILGLSKK